MLRAHSVTVEFPGVRALDRVSLDFRAGEIHAIIGENGAGKSTLMQVLSGAIPATEGSVMRGGVPLRLNHPSDARRAGIAMVHQEINLIETLSVADNIALGHESVRFGGLIIDAQRQHDRAREVLGALGAKIDPSQLASSLSIAQAQFVEIAKCVASEARVLIFDEPTAVLGARDAERLLALMVQMRMDGRAVLFVSHHLDEVVAIADRVSVLRDGEVVQSFERGTNGALTDVAGARVDEGVLARAMVGRELGSIYPPITLETDDHASCRCEPAIELVDFGAHGRSRGINLAVGAGEIVGIAGLVGSGRTETAEAIVGLRERVGTVRVGGVAVRFSNVRAAMKAGIAYVSEDRKGRGVHTTLSTIENIVLPSLDASTRFAGAWIDRAQQDAVAAKWIQTFGIRCPVPQRALSSLSGGNQQKVALARWLETKPRVLIVDEPTRGVDVGAKSEIYSILANLARGGLACLVISSELPELIGISHRLVVMRHGTTAGELSSAQLRAHGADEHIMRLASGVASDKDQTS